MALEIDHPRGAPVVIGLASAAALALITWKGELALGLLIAGGMGILLFRAPSVASLVPWSIFVLVPEWQSDLQFGPGLSILTYRTIAGPVDLADLALASGLIATLFVRPRAPSELIHRHPRVVRAYAWFVGAIVLSMAANGQLLHVVPLKPIIYMAAAVYWGFAVASMPGAASWIIPLFLAGAAANIALGLVNAIAGTGREFAGLHLAFYDRASVFLIIIALLMLLEAAIHGSSLVRGVRAWLWSVFAGLGLLAVALSLRRTMWLTLVLAAVVAFALELRRGRRRALAVAVAATLALGSLTAVVLARTGYLGTLVTHATSLVATLKGTGEEVSISDRLLEEVDAFRSARRSPVWGGGPLARYQPSFAYMPSLNTTYVHNNYMWLFLHYGILGLASYIWFLVEVVRAMIREAGSAASVPSARAFRLGVVTSLLALLPALAGDAFLTSAHRWPLLVGFLIGAALAPVHGRAVATP